MLIQERANMVMYDNKNRYPDDTDTPPRVPGGATSSTAGPSSSLPDLPSSSANAAGSAAAPIEEMNAGEGAEEEESGTNDEMDEDGDNPPDEGPLTRLMNNLRDQQNEALAFERFSDANEMQTGIMLVLECSQRWYRAEL
eukprot:s2263_g8.t1